MFLVAPLVDEILSSKLHHSITQNELNTYAYLYLCEKLFLLSSGNKVIQSVS